MRDKTEMDSLISSAATASINRTGLAQAGSVAPFTTLSYLPPFTPQSWAKEVDYLLRNGWVPCLEFELEVNYNRDQNHRSPAYYDGSYWTMKLPMFGFT
ncbi:Ribulose bisphosphate carboxylase small chain [Quillaja saponaria]|uniref:Ribulose bisphosphate carboxylase small subunit n=1 Tax=Quillaja saponaria TaxID=32244 RepID=A0AAD7PFV9_QUISA|nr:Ribulose bisphosphate carboxylase small chain [Quillaja saponaria]